MEGYPYIRKDFPCVRTQFKKGDPAQSEVGRKGGSQRTDAKKLAAKLRWMKKKGLSNEASKQIYELMTDHNMNALDIRVFLESIKKDANSTYEKINLARVMIDWHKAHFGEKIKSENVNVNVNTTIEEWERRLYKEINDEKTSN
jgi:hypothetical protein